MCTERLRRTRASEAGLTLVELIIFIVVISVALVGVLSVLNTTVQHSADPLVRKQMLAIAEGLLEEVAAQPFTWCDPDDPKAEAATSAANCTTAEDLGPEAEEDRGTFDNVNDYHGLTLNPVTAITGSSLAPAGYSAAIQIIPEALNGIASGEALRILVTVTHGSDSLVLEGYRTRHSPGFTP